jgi:O-antigen biosynthesis protein
LSDYRRWRSTHDAIHASQAIAKPVLMMPVVFGILVVIPDTSKSSDIEVTLRSLSAQMNAQLEVHALVGQSLRQECERICAELRLNRTLAFVDQAEGAWLVALANCRGDLLAAIWAGDELRPWALCEIARCMRIGSEDVDLIYADHDVLTATGYAEPHFNPAWSPVFLSHYNYIGNTWFVRATTLRRLIEPAATVDATELLLRVGKEGGIISHIPAILTSVHYQEERACPRSLPASESKARPLVSIIVPSRAADPQGLETCLAGLVEGTSYGNVEILVILNNLADPAPSLDWLAALPVTVLHRDGPFNWSAINNFAARQARGDFLLFLNDDVVVQDPDWLLFMVSTMADDRAAAVGPVLEYENGTVQHAGINFVYHGGGAQHLFRNFDLQHPNARWLARFPREVSAVTGACMLVRRSAFERLKGFDEAFAIVSNDTDFCIRLWREGMTVLLEPRARLVHHEGISRAGLAEMDDVLRFWDKWEAFLRAGDVFWNPNLAFDRDDWSADLELIEWRSPRTINSKTGTTVKWPEDGTSL